MREKTFWKVLGCVVAVGVVLTLAHFAYALYAYQHCSILYFIGMELW